MAASRTRSTTPDEARGARHRRILAVGLVLVMLAGAARAVQAGNLRGTAEVQYQRQELQRGTSEIWYQSYQFDHSFHLNPTTEFQSQLEYRHQRLDGGNGINRLPRGSLRLSNPEYGVFGSYRPSFTRDARAGEFRTNETLVTGFWARPGLPRLDVDWTRRERDNGATLGHNRAARMSWNVGTLSLRGGLGNQSEKVDGQESRETQRFADFGSSWHFAPLPRATVTVAYDFSRNRTGRTDEKAVNTLHGTSLTGGWQANRWSDVSLSYIFRYTSVDARSRLLLRDHDGSALYNIHPLPGTLVSLGGGLRTNREVGGESLIRYVTALATAEGPIRPGLTGLLSAAHSSNWQEGGGDFTADSFRGTARCRVREGLEATGDLIFSSVGDTARATEKFSTQASVGLTARPLPPLSISLSGQEYRRGEGWFQADNRSWSNRAEVSWRPARAFDTRAEWSRSIPLAGGVASPKYTTQMYSVRWSPGARLQFDTVWQRSSSSRTGTNSGGSLTGREVMSSRVLWALTRRWRVNIGFSQADPGRSTHVRQVDATVTWRIFE